MREDVLFGTWRNSSRSINGTDGPRPASSLYIFQWDTCYQAEKGKRKKMKYLGKETKVEVKTKSVRKVEYIRCDGCGKKIIPYDYRTRNDSSYIRIHTWHSDWGNDSVDSHKYGDYCVECAKSFVSAYVDEMNGSEELELKHKYLVSNDMYEGYKKYDDGYALAEDDKK